ncbi:MAG TPA: hypothetical protein VKE22_07775 [Haliangiales bacterium]|nr:hypothetical protein [Haliangiales bacterium]
MTVILGGVRSAPAAEGTEIATAFDEGNPFDIFFRVDYAFDVRRAAIKRELSGSTVPGQVPDTVPVVRDLVMNQTRHVLTPSVQVGLWHDVQLSIALPITISLDRSYDFDQRADPCIFPGGSGPATCVNRQNSSTLLDNILPNGSTGRIGYDAQDATTNFGLDSTMVFRSVGRSGLDTLNIGLTWAPMNQERDDTKPTWVVGAELRWSIGKIMKFNRLNPGNETGVSPGFHEIKLMTGFSKRTRWAEPFVFFYYQAPVGVRGDKPNDPDGSLFWDVGFGQKSNHPQSQAGTDFGFEAILFDRPAQKERLALTFGGSLHAMFEGKGYSEMWEPFALGGDVTSNPGAVLAVDPDPTSTTDANIPHPGVTTIENYMIFGGQLGIRGQIGEHVKFMASFGVTREQSHAITFTSAGIDLPGCSATVTMNCESPDDNVVTPGTREVNPLHKPIIDTVGRRYLVDETTVLTFMVGGQVLF